MVLVDIKKLWQAIIVLLSFFFKTKIVRRKVGDKKNIWQIFQFTSGRAKSDSEDFKLIFGVFGAYALIYSTNFHVNVSKHINHFTLDSLLTKLSIHQNLFSPP
jgi:hypothetical protein